MTTVSGHYKLECKVRELEENLRGERLLSEKRRTDGIEMLLEIKQLKEELKHYKEPFEMRPTYQILEQKLEKIKELDLELIQFYLEKLFQFYVNNKAEKSTTDQLHEKLEQLRKLKEILGEKE